MFNAYSNFKSCYAAFVAPKIRKMSLNCVNIGITPKEPEKGSIKFMK